PMYNSPRTGQMYFEELYQGHHQRFYNEFGMSKLVFRRLQMELATYGGFTHTRYTTMDEQLAIFLH
ncbi:hypothetical protein SCHPADRAFT_797797, partial [Schizopora paradoxa]